ncbi:unnamed protein product [Coffea canephora]|uniref:DH200=94 genomic scaffold, scaffold_572 n=1 Tax=Coffea canephora TaxID=49390 RepID=A0A068VFX8_COFCA|nr:unnamed protein product [Coffea canephora]
MPYLELLLFWDKWVNCLWPAKEFYYYRLGWLADVLLQLARLNRYAKKTSKSNQSITLHTF